MPDTTLKEAIKEAYASATGIIYHTFEIRHPNFTEPLRVVRDHTPLIARLELTAPENAGSDVYFAAYKFDFVKPEVSAQGVPQIQITIDNVSREIVANINAAMSSQELLKGTYREYLDSDLTGPQNDPPIHVDILSISANVFTVTAVAGFINLMNKKFPTQEYSTRRFPGLIQ